MHATMKDIARECGVTKMTVSRVMAGRSGVKADTREKVMEAAKRLNYEVNLLAQNFNFNKSGFIGIATPFAYMLDSPYLAEAFRGFQAALNGTGLDFALFDTHSDSFNDGAKLAKLYRQRKVDGLLLVALHTTDRFMDTLENIRIPMVVVGENTASSAVCSVSCDDEQGIRLMCSHLYSLGHRRIAFVGGPDNYASAERRKQAYIKFCKRKGLQNPPSFIQPGDFSDHAIEVSLSLLREKPRPTAIIAANDTMALGVMQAAQQLKLRIPEDLSVGGFDDLPNQADRSPLTTVHQPVLEMSERSARLLLEALSKGTLPTGKLVMPVSLTTRKSTGPCK